MKPYIRCPKCGYDIDVSDYEEEGEVVWCRICDNRTYYFLGNVKMQRDIENNANPIYQYNEAQKAVSILWKIKILRGSASDAKEICDIIDSMDRLLYNLQLKIHKDDTET